MFFLGKRVRLRSSYYVVKPRPNFGGMRVRGRASLGLAQLCDKYDKILPTSMDGAEALQRLKRSCQH